MDILILMKHEMSLAAMLAILLLVKVGGKDRENKSWILIFNTLLFVSCVLGLLLNTDGAIFGGMFFTNDTIVFEKNILFTALLIIVLSCNDWLLKQRHLPEFYMLIISSLLGIFLMVSSGNILMFYLAVEMSAIPVAALCNFNQNERRSSEAAMKMIFSSAFSSCIMLLGISFLYGAAGSLEYSVLSSSQPSLLFLTGFTLFFSGIIFKLSVVPFHFWTADVYEGSPIAVTSFLSVISKGGMVFVLSYLLYNVFPNIRDTWSPLICILSVITMITGNLFAIRQQNLKRFLAFSSITQVGFILIGISGTAVDGFTSSVYFIVIYIFSNLAAFAVVSRISELTGKETISHYKGLAKTNPRLAWSMAIALFSLAGIPPTAGFFGKIFLLVSGASTGNYVLITIAALNMMVALYYYLRVIRAMFMETSDEVIPFFRSGISFRIALGVCITGILIFGFFGSVYEFIYTLSR